MASNKNKSGLDDILKIGKKIYKSTNKTSNKASSSKIKREYASKKTTSSSKRYTGESKRKSSSSTSVVSGENLLKDMSVTAVKSATSRTSTKNLAVKVITYAILWIILLVTIPFSTSIEKEINRPSFAFSSTEGEYSVHFVDVGQGDCTIILLPDGKVVMIDTGPASSRNNLSKYLSSMTFTTIDYLILTHPDEDHIGNACMIYDRYEVLHSYVPKVSSNYMESRGLNESNFKVVTSNVWSNTTQSMYNENCEITYNFRDVKIYDETSIYGYSIDFFTPLEDRQSTNNDYSPIILVNLQNTKYLFTGDASTEKEEEFLTEYSPLVSSGYFDVDVLQVGHHGSKYSSSTDFLNAVTAEIAVISCGSGNKYGHPHSEAVTRLTSCGCQIRRTDEEGSIVMTADSSIENKVATQSHFHRNTDFYLEWKYVLIIGGVLLLVLSYILFKKSRKAKQR